MKIGKKRRIANYEHELIKHLGNCAICSGIIISVNGVTPICEKLQDIHTRKGRPKTKK